MPRTPTPSPDQQAAAPQLPAMETRQPPADAAGSPPSQRPGGSAPSKDIPHTAVQLLAADRAAAARLAADWPARGDPDHADRITQVLIAAGVTHPAVLLAGTMLSAVRDGGCPLTRVQRRFGEQVAVLIARQLPLPDQAGHAYPRGHRPRAVPPEWLRVARELPLAAELLALADLCVLSGVGPQASRVGPAAASSAASGRRPAASARPETTHLPRPRPADLRPPDLDRADTQPALPRTRAAPR